MVNYLNEPGQPPRNASRRFAIVVSTYNASITRQLLNGALTTLEQHGTPTANIDIVRVPGAWELALATQELAASATYDGIVSLGAVIRGETTHDQHINRFVSMALGKISLETRTPIGFGLLTCETFDQARERSGGTMGNKGNEATLAMLEMVALLERLEETRHE